jgi:hypothetical protein
VEPAENLGAHGPAPGSMAAKLLASREATFCADLANLAHFTDLGLPQNKTNTQLSVPCRPTYRALQYVGASCYEGGRRMVDPG